MNNKFNKFTLKKFRQWNSFVNDFNKAIPEIDYSTASQEDLEECIKILLRTAKKMKKRAKELKGERK